jgi:hypothetical protein
VNDGEEDHGEEVLHAEDCDGHRGLEQGVGPALNTQVVAFQQLQQILNTDSVSYLDTGSSFLAAPANPEHMQGQLSRHR